MPREKNYTTFNIDELITAYIDNQIPNAELKSQIEKLINSDETIRKKYLCELLLKNYLREKLPMHDPPARLAFQMYEPSVERSSNFVLHQKAQSAPRVQYPTFTENLMSTVKRKFLGVPVYG
ncbi:MAG: hypothetical protein N2510_09110, partial [Ignavibacteria bacterium]|nr:hypothetical protein [Ignavibacteria bacterium]